jgi:hypothetical protein
VSEARVPLWARRAAFAAVLAVAAVAPGPSSGPPPSSCRAPHCEIAGTLRWARPLTGVWLAAPGDAGTVPAGGQAYAAMDGQLAAVGVGLTVHAYRAAGGQPLWTVTLAGFPAGSAIVAVRAWPGAVTVGVDVPGPAGTRREEVVLAAGTGRRLHVYPAAPFGGAVAAGPGWLVVVGPRSVTSYDRDGRVRWTRFTGTAAQAWRSDGRWLYVTVAGKGHPGTSPVTAVRRISLRTGAQRVVRPRRGGFAGSLSLAFGSVMLFTDAGGVSAYSAGTGRLLWRRAGALPEGADPVAGLIYLVTGNVLTGVDPGSGETETRVAGAAAGSSSGVYAVQRGVLLGLDHGAQGRAWGYSVARQRVVWTSVPLPWPHYFVDLSGIGGSSPPGLDVVLLTICRRLGPAADGGAGQRCTRPELIAVTGLPAGRATPR